MAGDAAERQIDAISIGISANVAGLKQSLSDAQTVVNQFKFKPPGSQTVSVSVKLLTGGADDSFKSFMRRHQDQTLNVNVVLNPTRQSINDFKRSIKTKLGEGDALDIPFTADLKSAKAIKQSIQDALNAAGPVMVQVAWEYKNGPPPTGGGPGGTPPTGGGPAPKTGGGPAPKSGPAPKGGARPTPAPATPATGTAPQAPTTPTAPTTTITKPPRIAPTKAGTGGGRTQTAARTPATPATPIAPTASVTPTGYRGGATWLEGLKAQGNLGRQGTEFQPQAGARRLPGQFALPGFDARIKSAIQLLLQTGDPARLYEALGPYGQGLVRGPQGEYAATKTSTGKFVGGYNLKGLGGEDVNLVKLLNQAQAFAASYSQRKANAPLRDYEAYTNRALRLRTDTLDYGAQLMRVADRFVKHASRKAAANQGIYSESDLGRAARLRQSFRDFSSRAHAEDPKSIQAYRDPRRGSVLKLSDLGLQQFSGIGSLAHELAQIGPPSPQLLEILEGSARNNKALQARDKWVENARKRAQRPDRIGSTLVDPETGKKKTTISAGLPFVREQGISDVQSFLSLLDTVQGSGGIPFKKLALGGLIGYHGGGYMGMGGRIPKVVDHSRYALGGKLKDKVGRARIARDIAGPPLEFADREDMWMGDIPIDLRHDNWLFHPRNKRESIEEMAQQFAYLGRGKRFMKHAMGGHVGYALGGTLGKFFPNAKIELPHTDKQTEMLLGEVGERFAGRYPKSAASLHHLGLIHPDDLRDTESSTGVARARSWFGPGALPHSIDEHNIQAEIRFHPKWWAKPGMAAAIDYHGQQRLYHPRVPKHFAGLASIFGHELGHVLNYQHPGAEKLIESPASQYGAKSKTENFAEHHVSSLLNERGETIFMSLAKAEHHRAMGGQARKPWGKHGAYVVGEQGDEVFVPESAGWIIPHRLMDQLPKRAGGGEEDDPKNPLAGRPRVPEGFKGAGGTLIPTDPTRAFQAGANAVRVVTVSASGGPVEAKAGATYSATSRHTLEAMAEAQARSGGATGPNVGLSEYIESGGKFTPTRSQLADANIRAIQEGILDRQRSALLRAGLAERIAQLPQRAPGPGTGQLLVNLTGGRNEALERRGLAQVALTATGRLGALREQEIRFQDLQEKRISFAREHGEDEEAIVKMTDALESSKKAASDYSEQIDAISTAAESMGDKINPLSRILKVFGTNLGGVIAGTFLYGTAFKAVQVAIDAFVPALGDAVDTQLGFVAKSTAVTSALAQQTTALHGNADAAIATAAATAGLGGDTTDYLTTQLKLTAQIKAGAQAQAQASDLFRAAAGVGNGTPQGLYSGYGGLLGTPLLAQQFGGGKGFSETVFGDLTGLQNGKGPDIANAIGKGLSYFGNPSARQFINKSAREQGNPLFDVLGTVGGALPFGAGGALGLIDQTIGGGATPAPGTELDANGQPRLNPVAAKYIQSLNANIGRAGGTAQFTYTTNNDERQAGAQAAALAGDLNGAAAASQGFIVKVNGAAASAEDYKKALEDAAKGATVQSPETLLAAAARQREIGQAVLQAQAERQVSTVLPQQAALQYYGQRPLPFGTTFKPPQGAQGFGGFLPTSAAITSAFGQYKDIATGAFDYVQNYAKQGLQSLKDSGVQGIDDYVKTGADILKIQTGLAQQVSTLQAVEYNHQLYIANRNLKDAVALTGKRVANEGSNLGYLQRQTFLLERQGTLLSLQLGQRQINFQKSIAGFQAPGLTGEERAARIEEAKIEAAYAQKQLDIQKKQFGIQGQVFNVSALRQLNDVKFALQDIQAAHGIEINTKAANEAIGLLQQQLAVQGAKIGAQISYNEAVFSAKINESAQIAATATGTAFTEIFKGVNKAWDQFAQGAQSWYKWAQGLSGAGVTANAQADLGGPGHPGRAGGVLFNTQGAATMTVGEAGSETVAVLRNPRQFSPTSGGGGGGLTVIFQNTQVRDDSDIQKIVVAVEKAMNRRAALTLPRIS